MNVFNYVLPIMGIFLSLSTLWFIMIYLPDKHRKTITTKLGDLAALHRIMNKIVSETSAGRVLIWKSHNGDGIPRPGYKLKITAMYISYEPPFKNVVGKYDGVVTDGNYVLMLDEIRQHGSKSIWGANLDVGSLLYNMAVDDGVFWEYYHFLGADHENCYYVSIATSNEKTPFTSGDELKLKLAFDFMAGQFQRLNQNRIMRIKEYFFN